MSDDNFGVGVFVGTLLMTVFTIILLHLTGVKANNVAVNKAMKECQQKHETCDYEVVTFPLVRGDVE